MCKWRAGSLCRETTEGVYGENWDGLYMKSWGALSRQNWEDCTASTEEVLLVEVLSLSRKCIVEVGGGEEGRGR